MHESLLAGLTVIVDGIGPAVGVVASSLRAIGVGRVHCGGYAAEPVLWADAGDRSGPYDGVEDVAAVVFVRASPLDSAIAAPWWRAGVTHLPVVLDSDQAEIGPLIVPGLSSCARCHELVRFGRRTSIGPHRHSGPDQRPRLDRPSSLVAQPRAADPGTTVLAAAVVAVTLRSALLGNRDLVGLSSEVHADRPEVLHRHWARQPDCPCAGGLARGAVHGSGALVPTPWTMGA